MVESDRKRSWGGEVEKKGEECGSWRNRGAVNAGGRKEHIASGNKQWVTQTVQDTVDSVVGTTVLAKDGEHDGAQPVVLELYTACHEHLSGLGPVSCHSFSQAQLGE